MTVKIYSTPTCIWCHRAKEFLDKNKIKYTDFDVSSDRKAAMEMVQKSHQMGTPVLDINGNIVIGFDEPKIRELLKLK